MLAIEGLNNNQIELCVTDLTGKAIFTRLCTPSSNNLLVPIDISSVEEGVYFVRINDGKIVSKPIIISHD